MKKIITLAVFALLTTNVFAANCTFQLSQGDGSGNVPDWARAGAINATAVPGEALDDILDALNEKGYTQEVVDLGKPADLKIEIVTKFGPFAGHYLGSISVSIEDNLRGYTQTARQETKSGGRLMTEKRLKKLMKSYPEFVASRVRKCIH